MFKKKFSMLLSLTFFLVLFVAVVLATNLIFNVTSSFYDRYEDFNITTNYEVNS